ncbi:VOC family protein [Rhizobium sullae]|uniref:VOC family protein n=1 Tax=Rhizobium sullae TaxID=50338 RepID=UPI000B35D9C4|nr:hypothetical protein [Rhizobium sullae]
MAGLRNLPVADLAKSKAFYEAIGAVNQPNFTDETSACMVFSETTFIMLLTHDKFSQFRSKRIADAYSPSEMLLVISQESREVWIRSPTRRSRPVDARRVIRRRVRLSCTAAVRRQPSAAFLLVVDPLRYRPAQVPIVCGPLFHVALLMAFAGSTVVCAVDTWSPHEGFSLEGSSNVP